MPSAGALIAPTITVLSRCGRTAPNIDTATFMYLESESPYTKIYFTTDASKPNPFQMRIAGREITFLYNGPFTMKPGKRTLKTITVSRDGLQESNVVTRNFNVEDVGQPTDDDEHWIANLSEEEMRNYRKNIPARGPLNGATFSNGTPKKSKSRNTHTKEAWGNTTASYISHSDSKPITEGPSESKVEVPDNAGFTPTNYSGTQYNFWGVAPSTIPVNGTSGNAISYPYHSHLGCMTQEMLSNLNHKSHQLSVDEMRRLLAEEASKMKAIQPPPPPPPPEQKIVEVPLEPVLKDKSSGTWRQQIDHIYAHMIDQCKKDPNLRNKLAGSKLGVVKSVDFEGKEKGFLLTVSVLRTDTPPQPPQQPKPVQRTIEKAVKQTPVQAPEKKKKPVEKPKPKPQPPPPKKVPEVKKNEDPYFVMEEYEAEGTLKPWEAFNVEKDCEVLRKAMKGIGTDEKAIINVMGYRSSVQRQDIVKMFKTMFGKDLEKELDSELSGNFRLACKSLCKGAAEYDATELHTAIEGLGTDEGCLVEILCTRTNQQIQIIKETYKKLFNVELEKDVIDDTSGHFKRLLVSQLQGNRSESKEYDETAAKADAQALYKAGEGKWGTDESKFNEILCQRSFPHLRAVFKAYATIGKKDIIDAIKSEFSGDILQGLLAVVRCIQDKPAYFAHRLMKSMKGLGTDDRTLIRVVISRCEADMVQIKKSFETNYKGTLTEWIKDDTSGDYLKILMALIGEREAPVPTAEELADADPEPELEEMEEEVIEETGTLKPVENFNANSDCEKLRKAMKGLGTDEAAIISIMGDRSVEQRLELVKTYKTMYGKDLEKELKSETSGNFKQLLSSLCQDPVTFAASGLKKAMRGLGTDENALIEIICTKNSQEMAAIVDKYKELYKKTLEEDIVSDTSGHFKRLLVALVQANRPDTGNTIDRAKARKDAKALFEAGEKKWGTDESRFNVILCSRSFPQLRATFEEYAKLSGKDIEESIKSEMSSDLKNGMLTVVACIRSKAKQYANRLYKAMKGLGTDDDALIRIITSRCEIDMVQIKAFFQQLYDQSLEDFVKDDTSGDYRKLLLALIS